MMAGLLDVAETDNGWPLSLAGPALMPVSATVCAGASSLSVTGFGASKVGASLTALIVTGKERVAELFVPWPSLTVTLMVTDPLTSGSGVNVSVPVGAP